jgi:pimeloyl-ACP methyl ester carboxylesterase
MPKVMANGIQVHYQRVGEGPDLIMLHGITGNLAVWHLRIVPMLRRHFRIATVDLRGHGYSDMPPTGYTTGEMANDLGGLIDALEMSQPYIVGHSYGADIALNFALRHPERLQKLVAIEATIPALIHERKREDWEGWTFWAQALEEFGHPVPPDKKTDIDYMIRLSLQVPKVYGPTTGRARKAEPLLRLLDTTTLVKDYEDPCDLTADALARIVTPVLVLYGTGSAYMGTYRYLSEHLPICESHLLPATPYGGHFGPLEQPELLVEHILRFCQADTPPVLKSALVLEEMG